MTAPDRALRLFGGLCGIVGPVILVGSFAINPSPPPGLSTAALAHWAVLHEGQLLLGGWLQGIGSLLIVIFALALVELGGAASGFAGRIAQLAGPTILGVSLVEVTFYLAAAQAIAAGDVAAGLMSAGLIRAVQHVFLIAPALLLPIGVVILRSRVLGRAFGYCALAIGACLQALGLAGILVPLQPVVDAVLIIQAAWFVAAGVATALRGRGQVGALIPSAP